MNDPRSETVSFELLAEAWLNWGGSRWRYPRSDKIIAKELSWIACVMSEANKLSESPAEDLRQRAIFDSLSRVLHNTLGCTEQHRKWIAKVMLNEVEAELFQGWALLRIVRQSIAEAPLGLPDLNSARAMPYVEKVRIITQVRQSLLSVSLASGLVNDSLGMRNKLPEVLDDALAGMRAFHERSELLIVSNPASFKVPVLSPRRI